MKKKKKLNKKKFIKRIIQLIIIVLILVVAIKILSPKKQQKVENKLIVNNTDVTQNLSSRMYLDGENDVYFSLEDLKEIFDQDLYYEESTNKVITTCKIKVGAIDLDSNVLELNTASIIFSKGILSYDSKHYVPLSELKSLYNIEISVKNNNVVINSLYNELITAKTKKEVSLKEKAGAFSKTLEKIPEDETVIFLENAEKKGWLKVLTYNGNFGYIKENNLTERNKIRSNMDNTYPVVDPNNLEDPIEINKKDITTEKMQDFDSRKKIVNDLINKIISKEKFQVKMDLKDADIEKEKLERFVIELLPRMREIGASLIITNNNILEQSFLEKNNLK